MSRYIPPPPHPVSPAARAPAAIPWRGHVFWRGELGRWCLLWCGISVLLAAVCWSYRNLPYYWDALGYVVPHTLEIYRANLFPILRQWDVGHPTAYYFLLAAFMKIFGVGPLAGHLLNWSIVGMWLATTICCARTLGLPPVAAWATGALQVSFPLVSVFVLHVMNDTALAAFSIAALWLWATGHRWTYFLMGSLAALTKVPGFLLVCGPLGAVLVTSGSFWCSGRRRSFLREMLRALSPCLSLGGFLVVRWLVRGPGWTIDWKPIQRFPIWHWTAFREHLGQNLADLFVVSRLHHLAGAAVLVLGVAAAVIWLRRRHGRGPARWFASQPELRLLLALLFFAVAYDGALLQFDALLARYNLPVVGVVCLLLSYGLWRLWPRRAVLPLLYLLPICVYVLQWHPGRILDLPRPWRWLYPGPIDQPYHSENDLRCLDIIRVTQWAAGEILTDRREQGLPPSAGVAARWPFFVALGEPALGYVKEPLRALRIRGWNDVEARRFPYVLIVEPISDFASVPPADRFEARLVGERRRGEAHALIWYVTER